MVQKVEGSTADKSMTINAVGGGFRVRDKGLKDAVERIANHYDMSMSWVVRLAIKQLIMKFEKEQGIEVYHAKRGDSDTD